jgi:hypothetical protein
VIRARTLLLVIAIALTALASWGAAPAAADSITATCTPGPCGAWQARAVQVDWTLDVPSRARDEGCGRSTIVAQGVTSLTCSAFNIDGGRILFSTVTILVDTTPPQVTGAALTPTANALGWRTSPVSATFSGRDPGPTGAVSGIAACTQAPYGGPDTPAATVSGTCRDRAGNVSAPLTQTFAYDATPPGLGTSTAGIGDRLVRLRWSGAEAPVEIARSPGTGSDPTTVVYAGTARTFTDIRVRNGTTYHYTISVRDAAGNATMRPLVATPVRGVLEPANGAEVTAPPRLRWSEVRNATYYNVQVFRNGRKILSVWPKRPRFRLREQWTYRGRVERMVAGEYQVFAWPGFGRFATQRYGRRVGTLRFTRR